jgi:hypothetical protein
VFERAIQITTLDFRKDLRTDERQAELVARGASRTMDSRHLTGHAVDLVALDGEVSWPWEDYFRVAAAMQAAAHELDVPVLVAVGDRYSRSRPPKTASPTTSRPAGQPARSRSWTDHIFELIPSQTSAATKNAAAE